MITTRPRRGFLSIDVLIGLLLVSVLAAALGVAVARQRKASIEWGDARRAVRLAERTLIELRAGGTGPTTVEAGHAGVVVNSIESADAPPEGYQWVEVVATVRDRSATLVGLVPEGAVHP